MRVLISNFCVASCLLLLITGYAILPLESAQHALVCSVLAHSGVTVLVALTTLFSAIEFFTGLSVCRLAGVACTVSTQQDTIVVATANPVHNS